MTAPRAMWRGYLLIPVLALAVLLAPLIPLLEPSPHDGPQAAIRRVEEPLGAGVLVASADGKGLTLLAADGKRSATIALDAPPRALAVSADGQVAWVAMDTGIGLVDLAGGKISRVFAMSGGPISLVVDEGRNRAYVGRNDWKMAAVDLKEWRVLWEQPLGQQEEGILLPRHPVALLLSGNGRQLFALDQAGGALWRVDTASGRTMDGIVVGGYPSMVVRPGENGLLYVLVPDTKQVVVIDGEEWRERRRLTLPGRADGLALSHEGKVLYATGAAGGLLWRVDPSSGRLLATVKMKGQPSLILVAGNPARAYLADLTGGVRILDPVSGSSAGQAAAAGRPTALVWRPDPKTSRRAAARPPLPGPGASPATAFRENLPPGTVREIFVANADFPVAMAFAPDGRLFYNELHSGKIRVVESGRLKERPFYEFAVSGLPQAGLLGLALDPGFERNHYVYVLYTEAKGNVNGRANGPNRIVRLTDRDSVGSNPTFIGSPLPSGAIRNGGFLQFGPDGKLYVGLGDHEDGWIAANPESLAGKILRLNANGTIPRDNPFYGKGKEQPAMYALGLGNTMGVTFHPQTGKLFAVDNGLGMEEINLVQKGKNHGAPVPGWRRRAGDPQQADLVDPLAGFYPSTSLIGLEAYRGGRIPSWQNDLLVCNFRRGELRHLRLTPPYYDRITSEEVVTQGCQLAVVTGPGGALYFSDANTIYRIRPGQ